MPFKLNPFTGRLDYFESGGSGGGNVVGPGSSTTNDIAIFADTTGELLADSGILYTDVLTKQGNLSGLANTTTARSNLGLGSIAVLNDPLTETHGGTGQTSYTTGDTLYASATNTLSKLPIATLPGQQYEFNGTTPAWGSWLTEFRYFEDFTIASGNPPRWHIAIANGGDSNFPVQGDSGHPGVGQLTTGTAANGWAWMSLGPANNTTLGNFFLGGGSLDLYFVIILPVLSNGTDTYEISIGLGNNINTPNTSYDDGVFFNYSSTINSGNWQLSTSNATTKTVVNTATAITTNWTTLRININAAGTLCTFYVNGVSLGTIATNIPTNSVSPSLIIAKSAGTTSVNLNFDLVYFYQSLTSAR